MASYIYVPPNQQYYDPLQQLINLQGGIPQSLPQYQQAFPSFQTSIPQTPQHALTSGGLQPIHQLLLTNAARDVVPGTKRGSEEMLHPATQMLNNGMTKVDLSPDLEPRDAKKVKLDQLTDNNANQVTAPGKVIQVNGMPADSSEAELVQLAVPFGKVTNVALNRVKKQAFIEMAEVAQAATCVNYHQSVPAHIRGQQIFLSQTHKELKGDLSSNPAANAAVTAANAAQLSGTENDPKTALHIIVDNLIYPVTIDVLKQIFSRYGQVLKIIIFNKNNQFQALIQYSDPISAQTAKVSLDGQNIYNNCCTLRIDFSKLPNLNVKYNNEKSRDYTNPNLPPGEGVAMTSQSPGLESAPSPVSIQQQQTPTSRSANLHMTPVATLAPSMSTMSAAAGFGQQLSYMTAPTGAPQVMHHMPFPAQLQLNQGLGPMQGLPPLPGMQGLPGLPGQFPPPMPGLNPHQLMSMGISPMAASQMAANLAAIRLPPGAQQAGCVILVSNLDEEKATPDDLFTLFGVYGDVIRVKILYNKKDNALLQYSEPTQAQLALTHLDKIKVWGKQIRVAPSKHPIVQMPTDLQADGAKLTKDYTNSPLHRYKKKGSKNYQNIYPPSATLHLSNIPPDVKGELLKDEFSKYGHVMAFKFFEKDHKMALIQMETIDDAVMGLIGMHNFQLGETSHLRVSFSKSTISAPLAPVIINPMSLQPDQLI